MRESEGERERVRESEQEREYECLIQLYAALMCTAEALMTMVTWSTSVPWKLAGCVC